MDASSLLESLAADGFELRVVDEGRLSVTPAGRLTDALRSSIRLHRDALVRLISSHTPPPLTTEDRENIAEAIEERSAIMEHDGCLPRQRAEIQAKSRMRVYQALIAMPDGAPPRWVTYLAPGSTLPDARRDLALRFGAERVLKVLEHREPSEEVA